MRKFVSLLLLMGAFGYGLAQPLAIDTAWFRHVPSAHHLTYWFDNNSATAQELSLSQTSLQMDVSFLPLGVHTIHFYAVDSAGVVYPTSSAMFFCPPSIGSDSTAAQQVVYWFDQDFDNRHTASLLMGPQLLDVSNLSVGVHTLHSYVVGIDSTVYPTTSAMFFRPPYVDTDTAEAQALVYWFDQDFDSRNTVSSQGGFQWLDVSNLSVGVHTLHSYVVGIDSTVYPTTSAMFFRPPAMGADSTAAQEVVYWFDQDYANRRHTTMLSMTQMMDVSALSIGVHTLHSYVMGVDGTAYPTTSSMFFRPPVAGSEGSEGITQYYYWFNNDVTNATRVHVNPVTNPLQWYGLIPIDSIPFRSSYFHFELDTAQQPHAYAKNTFHTLFMDNLGKFVIGDAAPFVDYHVSQPVVSDTILPNTSETFPKVTNNNIKWFRLTAQRGDSLAFRSSRPCMLQLFDPTGREIYRTSGDTATYFGGTHAWYDGTYYLAVHDAIYTGSGSMTVEYQWVYKYALLQYTPNRISNASNVVTTYLLGNGFDELASVSLVGSNALVNMDTIIAHTNTEAYVLFAMNSSIPAGTYDLRLMFGRNDTIYDSIRVGRAVTVEEADYGQIVVTYNFYPTTSAPHIINVTVTNTGNVSSSSVPIVIAHTNPSRVSLNFGDNIIVGEDDGEVSNLYYHANNLFGDGINAKYIPLIIPHIDPYESMTFPIEYQCPTGSGFDFYAWTGKPWDHSRDNPIPTGGGEGGTDDGITMCDLPDPCEHVGEVECLCGATMGFIKMIAGSFGAIIGRERQQQNALLIENGMEPIYRLPRLESPSSILRGVFSHCAPERLGLINNITERIWDVLDGEDCPNPPTAIHPYIPSPPSDPNEITGYVSMSGSRYLPAGQLTIPYRIECENDSLLAESYAHQIIMRDTLNINLFDLTSYTLQRVTIGENVFVVEGQRNHIYTFDLRPRLSAIAQVEEHVDTTSGVAEWIITALDPITLNVITDPYNGLLPPNRHGDGVGSIEYSINLQRQFPDGDTITNRASIIFDYNAPIVTNKYINIIDAVAPTSGVVYGSTNHDTLILSFQSSDNRSGVWRYELYGRADTMNDWHLVANDIEGEVYACPMDAAMTDYYVVAIDSAGNRENKTPQVEYNTSRGVVGPSVTTYQIQFVNFDNTVLCSYRLPMGATPAYLGNTPSRNADAHYSYRFRGWTPAIAPVAGNAVYHAVYDSVPISYRICFFDYDSTLLQSDSLPNGAMPSYYSSIPSRPEVDSFVYAFVGWAPELMPVSGNADYRPVFDSMLYYQLPRYLVTFRNWNDSVLQSDSVTFGTMPHYWGMEPTREGNAYCDYHFRGWTPRLAPVTDSVVYTAEFDTMVHTYPVTFVNFNGAVLQQDTLTYGSMPVYRGNTPARRTTIQYTYTFVGWSPNIDTVRGAAIYTAVFDSVFSCISQYHHDYISTCDSVLWRGNEYATSGTYSEVVEGVAYGCDSVYVLYLTIKNKSYVTDEQTACDSYTWHGTTYTASTNTPTFTEQNVDGCDSVVTLHLTINHSNTGTDVQTACDSYTWHGTTYTASTNTPTFTEQNADGCDSVVTLHLTINHSNTGTEEQTACDSYTWHGTTYTASTNTPTFTEQNMAGCDSVVTLHLTINHSNTGTDVQTACDSYTWHGTTYTASTNTPTFIEQNADGCDSVVTLHLTINNSTSSEFDLADCDSVTWSDWTFYASTDTTIVLTNSVGCDSLNMLHLIVNYTVQTTIVDSAQGSYDWNGQTYTESGEYTFTTQTEAGCDSIVTLILTITQTEGILFDGFEQVTLYPNPTTGKVVINGMKVICLEVYDLNGRLVGTFMNTNSFDISQLSSGTYLVRITMPQGETIRRVIKH